MDLSVKALRTEKILASASNALRAPTLIPLILFPYHTLSLLASLNPPPPKKKKKKKKKTLSLGFLWLKMKYYTFFSFDALNLTFVC
jgi:hypothetical protein